MYRKLNNLKKVLLKKTLEIKNIFVSRVLTDTKLNYLLNPRIFVNFWFNLLKNKNLIYFYIKKILLLFLISSFAYFIINNTAGVQLFWSFNWEPPYVYKIKELVQHCIHMGTYSVRRLEAIRSLLTIVDVGCILIFYCLVFVLRFGVFDVSIKYLKENFNAPVYYFILWLILVVTSGANIIQFIMGTQIILFPDSGLLSENFNFISFLQSRIFFCVFVELLMPVLFIFSTNSMFIKIFVYFITMGFVMTVQDSLKGLNKLFMLFGELENFNQIFLDYFNITSCAPPDRWRLASEEMVWMRPLRTIEFRVNSVTGQQEFRYIDRELSEWIGGYLESPSKPSVAAIKPKFEVNLTPVVLSEKEPPCRSLLSEITWITASIEQRIDVMGAAVKVRETPRLSYLTNKSIIVFGKGANGVLPMPELAPVDPKINQVESIKTLQWMREINMERAYTNCSGSKKTVSLKIASAIDEGREWAQK